MRKERSEKLGDERELLAKTGGDGRDMLINSEAVDLGRQRLLQRPQPGDSGAQAGQLTRLCGRLEGERRHRQRLDGVVDVRLGDRAGRRGLRRGEPRLDGALAGEDGARGARLEGDRAEAGRSGAGGAAPRGKGGGGDRGAFRGRHCDVYFLRNCASVGLSSVGKMIYVYEFGELPVETGKRNKFLAASCC